MVMNKAGFMRVVEATIAIILVLGSIIILTSRQDFRVQGDLSELLPPILNELARDDVLREKIVKGDDVSGELKDFVEERIDNPSLKFEVRVCELDEDCGLVNAPENTADIYAAERVISASVGYSAFKPKKVKIFIWRD